MRIGAILVLCAAACSAASESLFNGRDLEGWKMVGPGRFTVQDGAMKTEGGMGLLWYSGRKIGNETLRVVFKTTGPKDNSGIVIRMPEAPTDAWYGVHNGFEIQIDASGPDEWHQTGAIYSLSKADKKAQKGPGEWNTMEISMAGPVTRIKLNGELVNEFNSTLKPPERKVWYEPVRGPRPDYGFIGLQNHDPQTTVYFREVTVESTPESPLPLTQGERDRLLSYYHSTRKQILDAVSGLTPAQWSFRPAPAKWSIAEVVEHLALTEEFLFAYALSFIDKNVPAPDRKAATEKLVSNMQSRSQPANAPAELRPTGRWAPGFELTREFRNRRDEMIRWINETKEPLRNRYAKWGSETVEIQQALHLIPAHTERHLAQINEVKAAAGYPK